jgi:hypothetical protein
MARMLSFLFQLDASTPTNIIANLTAGFGVAGKVPDEQGSHHASAGAAGQGSVVFPVIHEPEPAIVHYAWTNVMPAAFGPNWVMLTTVYDEEFAPYIQDLVNANPQPFTAAATHMKDYDKTKLPVDQHLTYFVNFIQQRDLAQQGRSPESGYVTSFCFAAYGWTVRQIYRNMPASDE